MNTVIPIHEHTRSELKPALKSVFVIPKRDSIFKNRRFNYEYVLTVFINETIHFIKYSNHVIL